MKSPLIGNTLKLVDVAMLVREVQGIDGFERWKQILTAEEQEAFESQMNKLMERGERYENMTAWQKFLYLFDFRAQMSEE